jgi:hypothetical protein
MEKIINCPSCSKPIDATGCEVHCLCPHCGFVSDWSRPDRRIFERIRKEVPITLQLNSEVLHIAKTKDVSEKGAAVLIESLPFVKTGDQTRCKIGEDKEMRDTKVVWTLEGKDKQRVASYSYKNIFSGIVFHIHEQVFRYLIS